MQLAPWKHTPAVLGIDDCIAQLTATHSSQQTHVAATQHQLLTAASQEHARVPQPLPQALLWVGYAICTLKESVCRYCLESVTCPVPNLTSSS